MYRSGVNSLFCLDQRQILFLQMHREKVPLDSAPSHLPGPPPYDAAISQLNSITNPSSSNNTPAQQSQKERNRNSIGGFFKDVVGAGIHTLKETGKFMTNKDHKYIQTGNVIQLISKASGHSIQILQTPQGQLFLDGTGNEGPSAYNSLFTVYKDPSSLAITLHNQFNYIAIINGALTLIQGAQTGPIDECYFSIHEVLGSGSKYVVFESCKEKGRYLAINPNGKMKSPLTTSYADPESQFAIRLIYTPNDVRK